MNAQTAKITPGAWSTDTGGDVTREDGTTLLTREQPSDCALDESFANAELAAEAVTGNSDRFTRKRAVTGNDHGSECALATR